MGVIRVSLSVLSVCVPAMLAINPVSAADFLPPPPPVDAPHAMPPAEFSGWYLRGDIGLGQNRQEKFRSTFDPAFVVAGLQYDEASLSSHYIFGAGLGYQFNSWLRGDATVEYNGGARWKQLESYTDAACGPAGRCVDVYRGRISSGVFLLNGYVDLGTWHGITPYLGAGVGAAHNHISAITDFGINTGGSGVSPAVTKTSLAWALMSGIAVNVGYNMKLDFGYRYLDKGNIDGGAIVCAAPPCGLETHKFRLASHDFRIGLRYMFGEKPYAPMQPPLVRKY